MEKHSRNWEFRWGIIEGFRGGILVEKGPGIAKFHGKTSQKSKISMENIPGIKDFHGKKHSRNLEFLWDFWTRLFVFLDSLFWEFLVSFLGFLDSSPWNFLDFFSGIVGLFFQEFLILSSRDFGL